jgi:hypothetical protein
MSTIKVKDLLPDFEEFSNKIQVKRLKEKMFEVCDERLSYVADELLLLSEEILSQVSAYGVCLYLKHGGALQTEKSNDFILHELFLHQGHQNAGPIFYKVSDLVIEIKTEISENEFKLFDSESPVNEKLQELAAFRNALMHGFFKLPASRNEEIIKSLQKILQDLIENYNIFKHTATFHFWNQEGFTGHWFIQDDTSWDNLAGNNLTLFEKLANKAKEELHSEDFVNSVSKSVSLSNEHLEKLENFISRKQSNNFKESLYVKFHPEDKQKQDEFYASAFNFLKESPNLKITSYSIDSEGIGYTSYLLFHRLLVELGLSTNEKDPKKKIKSEVTKIKDKEKLVILINNIHLVPFATDHITYLMKFFKESGIYFIGIGWEYEHLNSIFSDKLDLRNKKNTIPNEDEINTLLKNHTRHRGPYTSEDDFKNLNDVIRLICKKLKNNQPIIARRLADDEKIEIELINEALYILYPYLKYDQSGEDNNYIKDEPDELYGFPKNQTETSAIYLTLGRRDIDLEYKHKIVSL